MRYRLWDIHRLSIGNEHSAIDVETEIAPFNRSFYPAADIFGNFRAFYANHNLAFFGVICFNALKVHFNSTQKKKEKKTFTIALKLQTKIFKTLTKRCVRREP